MQSHQTLLQATLTHAYKPPTPSPAYTPFFLRVGNKFGEVSSEPAAESATKRKRQDSRLTERKQKERVNRKERKGPNLSLNPSQNQTAYDAVPVRVARLTNALREKKREGRATGVLAVYKPEEIVVNVVRPGPRANELEHLQVVQLVPVVDLLPGDEMTYGRKTNSKKRWVPQVLDNQNQKTASSLLPDKRKSVGAASAQGRGAG